MSYYQKSNFKVTSHAISRAKLRIKNWNNYDDFQIRIKIIQFLENNQFPEFSDNLYDYYHFPDNYNKYLYFIVDNKKGLVISLTPISYYKKINILC